MNAIVIEHVRLKELPPAWRAKFAQTANTRVTVRIEEEQAKVVEPAEEFVTDEQKLKQTSEGPSYGDRLRGYGAKLSPDIIVELNRCCGGFARAKIADFVQSRMRALEVRMEHQALDAFFTM